MWCFFAVLFAVASVAVSFTHIIRNRKIKKWLLVFSTCWTTRPHSRPRLTHCQDISIAYYCFMLCDAVEACCAIKIWKSPRMRALSKATICILRLRTATHLPHRTLSRIKGHELVRKIERICADNGDCWIFFFFCSLLLLFSLFSEH